MRDDAAAETLDSVGIHPGSDCQDDSPFTGDRRRDAWDRSHTRDVSRT
jgi:hypothetical protein